MAEDVHLPLYDELVNKYNVTFTAGGSAQNTVRAAQWLLPPGRTIYIGCIGNDENGRRLRETATGDGLQVEYMEVDHAPTGICACLITHNGQCRSLVAHLGAANHYRLEHAVSERIVVLLKDARCIYISGFFLTVSMDTVMYVVKLAHERGITVALNLSAPFICQFYKKQLLQVLPFVDLLFGNEAESTTLGKSLGLEYNRLEDIARHLSTLERTRQVIITQGADPTIVTNDTQIQTFPVKALEKNEIVDTNGAGDAFVGGFLSQFIENRPLETCIAAGHYTASVIIQRSGITFPPCPAQLSF